MNIKGFDKNLCCRGFQFKIGKEYKIDSDQLELCTNTVFHYCMSIQNVHQFYRVDKSRFCEIEVLGEEVTDGEKCGSNHIRIIREITGEELDVLVGRVNGNTGLFNSGYRNSGDRNSGDRNSGYRNSGDWNSGDWNSGDRNSGDWNSGDWNSGYRNSGDWNSGDRNSGDRNSGDRNSGDWNSGDRNSGDWNSGYRNSGYRNSGYRNSGDWNSGDWNSGYRNSGDWNSGDRNSGYRNSGDRNSGDWNSGDFNSCNGSNGVFCNEEDMNIRIFNKPSGMSLKEFRHSKYADALWSEPFNLTEWVEDETKTEGGYLKTYTYTEACANWWGRLSDEAKETIKSIPNFDADVFEGITGIKIEKGKVK